jgi:putative tryptophan/tyrosine transport system substrate-binding protein
LPGLASDLVRRQVAVIVAAGGNPSALAAKTVTATIPIVFYSGDPVAEGLVASLNRPGGNMTGMSTFAPALTGKRLDLLRELVPRAAVFAMLVNSDYAPAAAESAESENAARALGYKLSVLKASSKDGIEAAFATLAQQRPDALIVGADPFFNSQRAQFVELVMRYSIPTIYVWREFVVVGGLMSYGDNFADGYRQIGVYVGRILNGAKPADLPVIRPTKFELVIESQDRQGARSQRPADAARHRRRDHRIETFFAAVHESALGTKRISKRRPAMSAFGGKADISQT